MQCFFGGILNYACFYLDHHLCFRLARDLIKKKPFEPVRLKGLHPACLTLNDMFPYTLLHRMVMVMCYCCL